MRSLAQVQLAESSVVAGGERNLAKIVKADHCTVGVLKMPLQARLPGSVTRRNIDWPSANRLALLG